jgi:hypothetical protein
MVLDGKTCMSNGYTIVFEIIAPSDPEMAFSKGLNLTVMLLISGTTKCYTLYLIQNIDDERRKEKQRAEYEFDTLRGDLRRQQKFKSSNLTKSHTKVKWIFLLSLFSFFFFLSNMESQKLCDLYIPRKW